jgi:hypothetical protein
MDKVCQYYKVLKFGSEPSGMCCAGRKAKLPEPDPPPEPSSTLIAGGTEESNLFLKNVRKFDSCFQMTSFGAGEIVRDYYMSIFKVRGQLYHLAGSLLPMPDADYQFLQIYFMEDTGCQIDPRCR